MCIFYIFLTKFLPRGGRWCWLHRWRLVGSSRSEQRAPKERGRSEQRVRPSVSRQPLRRQPLPSAVSRCDLSRCPQPSAAAVSRCPQPSAVSRCRCPQPSAVAVAQSVRRLLGGRWQARRLTAALLRLGGRRQARRLWASARRLGLREAGAAAGCFALAAWGSLRLKLRYCPSSSSSSSAPALWGALAPFAMGAAAAAAAAVPPLWF